MDIGDIICRDHTSEWKEKSSGDQWRIQDFPWGPCTHWGCGPPTQALFGENVCKNERIGSHRGGRAPGTPPLDPPMEIYICDSKEDRLVDEIIEWDKKHQ